MPDKRPDPDILLARVRETVVRFTLPLTGTPPYVAPEEEMTGDYLSTSSEH